VLDWIERTSRRIGKAEEEHRLKFQRLQKPVLAKRGRVPTHCLVELCPKRGIVEGNILISLTDFKKITRASWQATASEKTKVPGATG